MRTIRNSHTPVCRLPSEVLGHIFSFTQTPLPKFMPISPRLKCDPTQAAENAWHTSILSGVCRYWRAVSLSFPPIWNTIDIGDANRAPNSNINLAMLCLRRSYAAPVDVRIWGEISDWAEPWVSETLASQSIRFRSFHLYDFRDGARLLNEFTECPAPELESLTIQSWPEEGPMGNPNPRLPVLFAGHTPRLRHLTLKFYSSWPGNNFNTLTHLCLEHQSTHPSSIRRTSDFLVLLASNPNLEELILNKGGPNDDGFLDSRVPAGRINLSRLRKLVIKGSPIPVVARILSHIRISPTALVQILRCRGGSAATLLTAVAGCANLANITRMRLECLVPSWAASESPGFSEIPRCIRLTGCGEASLDIFPGADVHEVASNQYMAALVGLLSACKIQELWLGADEVVIREPLWQRIYYSLPLLQKLHVGPLLAGLTETYPSLSTLYLADETMGLALPCANLNEIVILGATLDGDRLSDPPFRRLLQERARRGFPISRLEIITIPKDYQYRLSPALLDEDVTLLRHYVRHVFVRQTDAHFYPNMEGLAEVRLIGEQLY